MSLPTAREINPASEDLDGKHAERHFLGKSLEEAEALFRENSLCYQEDLLFMGPVAFRFYVRAAINYIRSEAAAGDSDIIHCFAGLLEFRLEHEAGELRPMASELASACGYMVQEYGRFELDPEIDGDVRSRLEALQEALSQLGEAAE